MLAAHCVTMTDNQFDAFMACSSTDRTVQDNMRHPGCHVVGKPAVLLPVQSTRECEVAQSTLCLVLRFEATLDTDGDGSISIEEFMAGPGRAATDQLLPIRSPQPPSNCCLIGPHFLSFPHVPCLHVPRPVAAHTGELLSAGPGRLQRVYCKTW